MAEDVAHQEGAAAYVATPKKKKKKKGAKYPMLAPKLFLIFAVFLLSLYILYPIVATYWNNYHQFTFAQEYGTQVEDIDDHKKSSSVEAAKEYNRTLDVSTLKDPILFKNNLEDEKYQEYLRQLSELEAMGTIKIPKIDVSLPIYHGTEDEALSRGAGHFYGSSLPVGGDSTHTIITAHSGLSNATMFDDLEEVEEGDKFTIDVMGEKVTYKIYDTEIVLPDETEALQPKIGKDIATLVTCTPYAINTHRLLVHGERVPNDIVQEKESTIGIFSMDWRVQDWMMDRLYLIGLANFFLLLVLTEEARRAMAALRKKRKRRGRHAAPKKFGKVFA